MFTFDVSNEFLELFTRYSTDRSLSDVTIYRYVSVINHFALYVGCDPVFCAPFKAYDYFRDLDLMVSKGELEKGTYDLKLCICRAIYQYALDNEFIQESDNMYKKVDFITIDYMIDPDSIPDKMEISNFLKYVSRDTRLYLIFLLVLDCGLASGEILNLKLCNINVSDDFTTLKVCGRRGVYRDVVVSSRVANVLNDYLTLRGGSGDDFLFLNGKGDRLVQPNFSVEMKGVLKRAVLAGVFNKVYDMSTLRHAAIVLMLCSRTRQEVSEYVGLSDVWFFRYEECLLRYDEVKINDSESS